jgi:hypothetical protein
MRYIYAELASVLAQAHARRPDCQNTSSRTARLALISDMLCYSSRFLMPLHASLVKKTARRKILRPAVLMLPIQNFIPARIEINRANGEPDKSTRRGTAKNA